MPLAYLMGVEWKDAGVVAELIGIKTFLNEFIAYDKLSGFIKNRVECQAGTVLSVSLILFGSSFYGILNCHRFFKFQ